MEWLAEILKNLSVSRILVAAIFISLVILYFGPLIEPGFIPKQRDDLVPFVFAAMLLSGMLLVLWFLIFAWDLIRNIAKKAMRALAGCAPLSDSENLMLYAMSHEPTQTLDLDRVEYNGLGLTKLELHQAAKKLRRKGFVSINPFASTLISLTDSGRSKALELQKSATKNDA